MTEHTCRVRGVGRSTPDTTTRKPRNEAKAKWTVNITLDTIDDACERDPIVKALIVCAYQCGRVAGDNRVQTPKLDKATRQPIVDKKSGKPITVNKPRTADTKEHMNVAMARIVKVLGTGAALASWSDVSEKDVDSVLLQHATGGLTLLDSDGAKIDYEAVKDGTTVPASVTFTDKGRARLESDGKAKALATLDSMVSLSSASAVSEVGNGVLAVGVWLKSLLSDSYQPCRRGGLFRIAQQVWPSVRTSGAKPTNGS